MFWLGIVYFEIGGASPILLNFELMIFKKVERNILDNTEYGILLFSNRNQILQNSGEFIFVYGIS